MTVLKKKYPLLTLCQQGCKVKIPILYCYFIVDLTFLRKSFFLLMEVFYYKTRIAD